MSRSVLIIFCKYPTLGEVKKNFIPLLGKDGAADLHKRMAEYLFGKISWMLMIFDIEIWYSGNLDDMRAWLGDSFTYKEQIQGSLGERMKYAAKDCFARGYESASIIWSDIPKLSPQTLKEATQALKTHELVLGPSLSGGYYYFGLTNQAFAKYDKLFDNVYLSNPCVFENIFNYARKLNVSLHMLPENESVLDCDDLGIWVEAHNTRQVVGHSISVIIPTFNEADSLLATLAATKSPYVVDIIVVDGGSTDATREIATSFGATVIRMDASRGQRMNFGASLSSGSILLFLHAGTILPSDFDLVCINSLSRPNVLLGSFSLSIKSKFFLHRLLEIGANLRSKLFHLPYGNQAFFLENEIFLAIGGFLDIPFFEEYTLVLRLRKQGGIFVSLKKVQVCAKSRSLFRFETFKTFFINQLVLICYNLGIHPIKMYDFYKKIRKIK